MLSEYCLLCVDVHYHILALCVQQSLHFCIYLFHSIFAQRMKCDSWVFSFPFSFSSFKKINESYTTFYMYIVQTTLSIILCYLLCFHLFGSYFVVRLPLQYEIHVYTQYISFTQQCCIWMSWYHFRRVYENYMMTSNARE